MGGFRLSGVASSRFNAEARCFLAAFDALELDKLAEWHVPDAKVVRPLIRTATEYFAPQRNNPLMSFAASQQLVIDFADVFLRWCADPSVPRWCELFDARERVRHVEGLLR